METAGLWRHQCGAEAGAPAATENNPKVTLSSNKGATLGWENARKGRWLAHILGCPWHRPEAQTHSAVGQQVHARVFSEHHVPIMGLRTEQVEE